VPLFTKHVKMSVEHLVDRISLFC